MHKSQFETIYLKTKTQTNLKLYKKRIKTFVVSYTKGKEKKKILSAIGYEKRYGQ